MPSGIHARLFSLAVREVHKDTRGAVAVLVALTFPILAGIAALAVDISFYLNAKNAAQGAADNAALSAIVAVKGGADTSGATNEAKGVAAANGFIDGTNGVKVTVNNPPTSGSYVGQANAYEVIISQPQSLFFGKGLGVAPTVSGRAVAAPSAVPSPTCMLALDPSATPNTKGIIGTGAGSLNASGSGTINLTNCNVYVNSPSSTSISVTGGGTISADYVTTVGNYSGSVLATKGGSPTVHASATADPYATSRSIPSWSSCSNTNKWSGSIANLTGVLAYCGSVSVTASTTLAPGVYIIGGSLTSASPISGNGVTIILSNSTPTSDNGIFDFKTGATLTLTAPTSGTTAGIVLWADARLPHNADTFSAGTSGNITGAIYLPSHLVNYSGSASTTSQCTQLVAAEIAVSGGATFTHNCTGVSVLDPSTGAGSGSGVVAGIPLE